MGNARAGLEDSAVKGSGMNENDSLDGYDAEALPQGNAYG
jgi:hypothetical protein